jgi:hypothetical protein
MLESKIRSRRARMKNKIQRYCRDSSGNLVTENLGNLMFFEDHQQALKAEREGFVEFLKDVDSRLVYDFLPNRVTRERIKAKIAELEKELT